MDFGEGVGVYAEAKGEYTKQLTQFMLPALQQFFLDLLEEAKQKEPEARKLLLKFQQLLEEIAEWNMDKVQRETNALNMATQCDYLEELLTAVFIAHTKVLSAIRLTARQKKLQITIPKLEHFLHRTLTECARLLWSNSYLYSTSVPSLERQRNMRTIETLLNDGILQAIRGMLPVKNILREYLREDAEEEEGEAAGADSEEEEEAAAPPAAPNTTPQTASVEEPPEAPAAEEAAAAVAAAAPPVLASPSAEAPTFSGLESTFTPIATEDTSPFEDAPALEEIDTIRIEEGPPEPMDEFEDLEKPAAVAVPPPPAKEESEVLSMDFEELPPLAGS